MRSLATPEALIARWDEICHDPSLHDLPYKVELNASGKIELRARTARRGLLVADLACQLQENLTSGGIRVPDVIWASSKTWPRREDAYLLERAPELCVEVCSPDGEEKISAYLAAGALEAWVVSDAGSIRYFNASGERAKSDFPFVAKLPQPLERWQ
jgi:Uma2 family endonuclease